MKVSKFKILYFFLKFRLSRNLSSNKVPGGRVKRWKKNLMSSSFYRPFLEGNSAFPVISKNEFMDNFDLINTVGIEKQEAFRVAEEAEKTRDFSPEINDVSVGLSSGTSGNRGIFLSSKREKEMWVGAILDRVLGFSLRKRKVAFFLRANNNLYEAINSRLLEFKFYDIIQGIEKHKQNLVDWDPDILVAQPSVLYEIARYYRQNAIVAKFTMVISVAEVLELDVQEFLETVFQCRIDQVYQCTEGFLAYTCQHGKMHVNEDWLAVEKKYLEGSTKRFQPIITDFLRTSQPIVRYQMNDILHEGLPCDCGSKAMVIDKIEGRIDDVFRFESSGLEIVVFPDSVRRAIIGVSELIMNYQLVRVGSHFFDLYLEENCEELYPKVEAALISMFMKFGISGLKFERKILKPQPSVKFTRVKNAFDPSVVKS